MLSLSLLSTALLWENKQTLVVESRPLAKETEDAISHTDWQQINHRTRPLLFTANVAQRREREREREASASDLLVRAVCLLFASNWLCCVEGGEDEQQHLEIGIEVGDHTPVNTVFVGSSPYDNWSQFHRIHFELKWALQCPLPCL